MRGDSAIRKEQISEPAFNPVGPAEFASVQIRYLNIYRDGMVCFFKAANFFLFRQMQMNGEQRMRMTDVSRQLMITKPAATQTVNKLVEKGLIERVQDENDRRVVYIRPSRAGTVIFERELEKRLDFMDRAVQRMGEADANQLVLLMDRFLCAVSDEVEEK